MIKSWVFELLNRNWSFVEGQHSFFIQLGVIVRWRTQGSSYEHMVAVLLLRVRSRWCTINASVMQPDASGRVGSVLYENTTLSGGLSFADVIFIKSWLKNWKLSKERLIWLIYFCWNWNWLKTDYTENGTLLKLDFVFNSQYDHGNGRGGNGGSVASLKVKTFPRNRVNGLRWWCIMGLVDGVDFIF